MIQAEKEIHDLRTYGEVLVTHHEIHNFVEKTPSAWAMLEVNLGVPEQDCKNVAYRVCLELSTGLPSLQAVDKEITKRQFERFKKTYIEDPKGSQEFFHRCVFGFFDKDHNGVGQMVDSTTTRAIPACTIRWQQTVGPDQPSEHPR